jgi:hypothetical protein
MDSRGIFTTAAITSLSGVVGTLVSCGTPDPAAITFSVRPGAGPDGIPSASSTSSSSGDGGASGGPDPIFQGAAFQHVDPGIKANDPAGNVTAAASHGGNVEGKDCVTIGCHLGGAKPWIFGGTVYSANTGGTTVGKAEIRVLDPAGKEVGKAYTDVNGNFWLASVAGATIPPGSKVGVRKEGGQAHIMATAVGNADASCNGARSNCHGTPATGNIYAK